MREKRYAQLVRRFLAQVACKIADVSFPASYLPTHRFGPLVRTNPLRANRRAAPVDDTDNCGLHFSETLALRNSIFLHAVRNWQFAPVFKVQSNNSIVCSIYFRLTCPHASFVLRNIAHEEISAARKLFDGCRLICDRAGVLNSLMAMSRLTASGAGRTC